MLVDYCETSLSIGEVFDFVHSLRKTLVVMIIERRKYRYQNIHHRNCYGHLVVHGRKELRHICELDGIRMVEYLDEYEKFHSFAKINHYDRDQLTQLTRNTVFCRS